MEPVSFEEVFLEEHERPYGALYFITGSQDDAEELMQDAFLKLWERRDFDRRGRGPGRLAVPGLAERIVCSGDDSVNGGGVIVIDVATGDIIHAAEGRSAIWLDDYRLFVKV